MNGFRLFARSRTARGAPLLVVAVLAIFVIVGTVRHQTLFAGEQWVETHPTLPALWTCVLGFFLTSRMAESERGSRRVMRSRLIWALGITCLAFAAVPIVAAWWPAGSIAPYVRTCALCVGMTFIAACLVGSRRTWMVGVLILLVWLYASFDDTGQPFFWALPYLPADVIAADGGVNVAAVALVGGLAWYVARDSREFALGFSA